MRAHKEAREAAERAGIEIRYYNIIYDLVDDIKATLSGMLPPTLREERLGEATIQEVFEVSKVGKVAGCRVTDGIVERGAHVRLIRDSVVIHEGKLKTLKRFKDDAKEVTSGQECGMAFENFENSFDRAASCRPLRCWMLAHLEWPAMVGSGVGNKAGGS